MIYLYMMLTFLYIQINSVFVLQNYILNSNDFPLYLATPKLKIQLSLYFLL